MELMTENSPVRPVGLFREEARLLQGRTENRLQGWTLWHKRLMLAGTVAIRDGRKESQVVSVEPHQESQLLLVT